MELKRWKIGFGNSKSENWKCKIGGGINWLLGCHDRARLVPAAVTLPRPPSPINKLPPLLGGRWVLDQSPVTLGWHSTNGTSEQRVALMVAPPWVPGLQLQLPFLFSNLQLWGQLLIRSNRCPLLVSTLRMKMIIIYQIRVLIDVGDATFTITRKRFLCKR